MVGPKEYELEPILRESGDFVEACVKSALRANGINNVPLSSHEAAFADEIAWWLFNVLQGSAIASTISMEHIATSGLVLAKRAHQVARRADQPSSLVPATVTTGYEITAYADRLVSSEAWQTYVEEHPATMAFADRLPAYLPGFQTPDAQAQLAVNRHYWNRAVEIGMIALDSQYQLTPATVEVMLAEVADLDSEWADLDAQ